MKNERKELIKKFNAVIEDLMDHYDQYTEEEKEQIKEVFQKVAELNKTLDKYDEAAQKAWEDYIIAASQYFNTFYY